MKAVFALAFLALARAAIIETPVWQQDNWFRVADPWFRTVDPIKQQLMQGHDMGMYLEDDVVSDIDYVKDLKPLWMRSMFEKYGLVKPEYDVDFMDFGKKIGVDDVHVLNHLRSLYEKPSLVFFQDPEGKIVSYFAHEGIDKADFMPEIKSAFSDLYGSSDALSIDFKPQDMLGHYKTLLPGHFFEPVKNLALARYMHELPVSHYHVPFKPQVKTVFNSFNIDALPNIYKKQAIPLDIEGFLSDAVPATHAGFPTTVKGFPMVGAFPFGKTMVHGVSPVDSVNYFRSGMGFSPLKSPAYHLVKADYPFFTAAPGVESVVASPTTGIPLMKTSPFFSVAEPSTGLFRSGHPLTASPLVKACEGCLVNEHGVTFAPVSGIHPSLFKGATFGEHALGHFGADGIPVFKTAGPATSLIGDHHFASVVPALRSAFPGVIYGNDDPMTFVSDGIPVLKTFGANGIPIRKTFGANGIPIRKTFGANGIPIRKTFGANGIPIRKTFEENGIPILKTDWETTGVPLSTVTGVPLKSATPIFGEPALSTFAPSTIGWKSF